MADTQLTCQSCGKQFKNRDELQRHEKECAAMKHVAGGQQNIGAGQPKPQDQPKPQQAGGNQPKGQPAGGQRQPGQRQGDQSGQRQGGEKTRTAGGGGGQGTEQDEI